MLVAGRAMRTIWLADDGAGVGIIDQTLLPHALATLKLATLDEAAHAIRAMQVRGAPLIGAAAAYGMALALRADAERCRDSKPPPRRCWRRGRPRSICAGRSRICGGCSRRCRRAARVAAAYRARGGDLRGGCRDQSRHRRRRPAADRGGVAEEGPAGPRRDPHPLQCRLARDRRLGHGAGADLSRARARHSASCLGRRDAAAQPGRQPHRLGARPAGHRAYGDRRQCRRPSDAAWPRRSLHRRHRSHHRLGRCRQQDRHLSEGARGARTTTCPFYVALPSPTIDWSLDDGVREIPIEERDPSEVTHIAGRADNGATVRVQLTPDGSPAANYAFDVTPARLVTGLITERGVAAASREGLLSLFPEMKTRAAGESRRGARITYRVRARSPSAYLEGHPEAQSSPGGDSEGLRVRKDGDGDIPDRISRYAWRGIPANGRPRPAPLRR